VSEAGTAPQQRVVLFEIGAAAYALPISEILEVADVGHIWAVPTLSPRVAGVVNHHGDALPVVAREQLFEGLPAELPEPDCVLVLGSVDGESGRLGVPVDRVFGLMDGDTPRAGGQELVVERRPVRGRVVAFLDARRLLDRAARAINEIPAPAGAIQGGRE
jgi:chemotaxis signal transduction protein